MKKHGITSTYKQYSFDCVNKPSWVMDHRLVIMWPKTGADLDDLVQLKACVVPCRNMELYLLIRGPYSFNRILRKKRKVAVVACLAKKQTKESQANIKLLASKARHLISTYIWTELIPYLYFVLEGVIPIKQRTSAVFV
jgi:hypothetical protein